MENICPVCKKEILAEEETITCPDCGQVYHTLCWESAGGCQDDECREKAAGLEKEKEDEDQPFVSVHDEAETVKCLSCGNEIDKDKPFCPYCGMKILPAAQTASAIKCPKCGAEVKENQKFCPKCGFALRSVQSPQTNQFTTKAPISPVNMSANTQVKKKKNALAVIVPIVAVILIGVIAFVAGSKMNSDSSEDENDEDSYETTVLEEETTTQLSEAEKRAIKLAKAYDDYCSMGWSTLASDGSCLTVDTNPDDKDEYIEMDAYYAVEKINKDLGFPESVYERMNTTSALDGRQEYDIEEYTVSWKYHPDNGMEIIYEVNR